MDGIEISPRKILLSPPYLTTPGLHLVGHGVFRHAAMPLELHIHKNCIEIVFVIEGEQVYFVEDTYYSLSGGYTFISFKDQPHGTSEKFQGLGEIYWLQLDLTYTDNFLGFNKELSHEVTRRLFMISKHIFRFNPAIKSLIKIVFDGLYLNGERIGGDSSLAVSALMYLITLMLEDAEQDSDFKNYLIELDKYIDEHITDMILPTELCHICGFSPSYFYRNFKEYFGRTPAEYIMDKKIKKSKELLKKGDTITDTAMTLGFNSSSYFSTVFKKFNGKSPKKWLIENN